MDHQVESGQVDAPRRHIGCHAHPCAPVAHGLQRMAALVLAEFAGQRHDREAPVGKARGQPVDRLAGVAEHQRIAGLVVAKHVDDGMLGIVGVDDQRAVFDVRVLGLLGGSGNANCVALVLLGQRGDGARHGCRKHQRAPVLGRFTENELQVLPEAQVEHLVGLVQHDGAQAAGLERAALDVVAQPARGGHNDVGAALQRVALGAHVHAADTRRHHGACLLIEPGELALDLHGKLAGWRDDQRQRFSRRAEAPVLVQQCRGYGNAEADRLARPGLGRNQQVGSFVFRACHFRLYGREG